MANQTGPILTLISGIINLIIAAIAVIAGIAMIITKGMMGMFVIFAGAIWSLFGFALVRANKKMRTGNKEERAKACSNAQGAGVFLIVMALLGARGSTPAMLFVIGLGLLSLVGGMIGK